MFLALFVFLLPPPGISFTQTAPSPLASTLLLSFFFFFLFFGPMSAVYAVKFHPFGHEVISVAALPSDAVTAAGARVAAAYADIASTPLDNSTSGTRVV